MEKRTRKTNTGKNKIREFEQKTIDIARVARVMEGGRRFSFRATVVIGNKKGKVGVGVAKALSVANAVEKAYADAKKNVIEFPLESRTIPHSISNKVGASRIILMPAKEGRGLVAGGTVRIVLELAGIKDITSKILGSGNKINNARATAEALKELADSLMVGGEEQEDEKKNQKTENAKIQKSEEKTIQKSKEKVEKKVKDA